MDEFCKKTSYTDKKQADIDVLRISKKSDRSKVPIRSYFCKKCKNWHLTSKDLIITPFIKIKMENEELLEKIKRFEIVNVDLENENFSLTNKIKNQKAELTRHCNNVKIKKDDIKRLERKVKNISKELSKKETLIKNTIALITRIENKFKKKNEVLSAINFKARGLESTIRKKDRAIRAIEKVLNNIK